MEQIKETTVHARLLASMAARGSRQPLWNVVFMYAITVNGFFFQQPCGMHNPHVAPFLDTATQSDSIWSVS
jgi:hypothetical protein